eukprot:scaffold88388_cov29-Tisochrysis_lutea.AAC.1
MDLKQSETLPNVCDTDSASDVELGSKQKARANRRATCEPAMRPSLVLALCRTYHSLLTVPQALLLPLPPLRDQHAISPFDSLSTTCATMLARAGRSYWH